MPVFRNMAHAGGGALADGRLCDVLSVQKDGSAHQRFQAGNAVDQFRLAVAVDAGDAHDFAPAHLEGNVLYGVVAVRLGGHGHVLNLQHNFARMGGAFFHVEIHVAAHHHGAQLFHGGVLCFHGADVFALAQNAAAICHGHDFRQLVADEEDGLAFSGQVLHDLHQFFDFLRRQHGGGLVEDQDFIVPVEHLQNLCALLHTDGNILNLCVGIHLQAVFFRQRNDLFPGLLFLQEAHGADRFHAHDDVIQHREALHQLEVLVHHADAQVVGVVRIVDLNFFAVLFDGALFRLIKAEKNAHQGGFPGPVFAQQRVDFSVAQLQGDIVVCDDARETFCDMQHLDGIFTCMRFAQCTAPAFLKSNA